MIKQFFFVVFDVIKDILEEFKKVDKVVIVVYVDVVDKVFSEVFFVVVEKFCDDYFFGVSIDVVFVEVEGVKVFVVVVYKDFDEGKFVFIERFEVEVIQKFVKMVVIFFIGEIGFEIYFDYMLVGFFFVYIFVEMVEECKEISEKFKFIVEVQCGVVNFGIIDVKVYGVYVGNFNFKIDKFFVFVIQEMVKNQKFFFDQEKEIIFEVIKIFVDDFVVGKVEFSIKFEFIFEKQEGFVMVVVVKSYNDIVFDDIKDVLIEFYVLWCGYCKFFVFKYDEFVSFYVKSEFKDKVVIVKVDVIVNDVFDEIQGFFIIKFYFVGVKNEFVIYFGFCIVDDFIKFVVENGKYKVFVFEEVEELLVVFVVFEEVSFVEFVVEIKEVVKEVDYDEFQKRSGFLYFKYFLWGYQG